MHEICVADASKRFDDILDAVEHRGETFTVVHEGRAIATIEPSQRPTCAICGGFCTRIRPIPFRLGARPRGPAVIRGLGVGGSE